MGSLQQALPHPVDGETEEAFQELLRSKMTGAVAMYVQAVRVVEEAYGPEAVEKIRQHRLARSVAGAAARGAQAQDSGVRAYCEAMDLACRGSHEWEKLEDSDTRQAYRYTRCLWAEVFRALGAEEIGLWICEGDGPAAAAFNPRIRFERTKTLMEGDECCDHVYWTEE